MFCLSHVLARLFEKDKEKVVLYASVISVIVYSLLYIYLIFFQQDFFQKFNKYIIYIIAIDLLLTALLHFFQKYNPSPSHVLDDDCSEDSVLSQEYDLYTQLDTQLDTQEHTQEHTLEQTQEQTQEHAQEHAQDHTQEPTQESIPEHTQDHTQEQTPVEIILDTPEKLPTIVEVDEHQLDIVKTKPKSIIRKRRVKKDTPEEE